MASTHVYSQWYEIGLEKVDQYRILNGEIEAINKATVSSQTSGRVEKFNYDVDDFVAKGSVIAEFTNTEQKARLVQATANANAAKIAFDQSVIDYDRIKEVYAKKLVAKSVFDQTLSNRNSLEAKSKASAAAMVNAEKQLEYTIIRAPYDGIVTNRYVEIGEVVNPGTPIMEGLSLTKLRVITHIPEKIIVQVKQNPEARVFINDKTIPTKELTIFPYAEKKTHTFKTRIEFDSEGIQIFPGMTVKVAFKIGEYNVVVIPTSAIITRSELTLVYVKAGDKKLLRHIKLGKQQNGRIEVVAGLTPGELVQINPLSNQ